MGGDLIAQMGDPAEWASDAIALIALGHSIVGGRKRRAAEFARQLEEATGYSGEQIGEILIRRRTWPSSLPLQLTRQVGPLMNESALS